MITRDFFALDTLCSIRIDSSHAALLPEAEQMVKEFEQRLSRHIPTSDISRLNSDRSIRSTELVGIIHQYNALPPEIKTLFSMTLGTIVDAWNIQGGGTVPDSALLRQLVHEALATHVNTRSDGTVVITGKGVVELGGLLKGYLCGELARFFESKGATRFIIDLGGNIAAYSVKPYTWKIGIKNPKGTGIIGYIQTDKQKIFAATSGNYERFFIHNGIRYHHIIDPMSGYPVTGVTSVTVMTQNAALSDILSTAMFVAGKDHVRYADAVTEAFVAVFLFEDSTFSSYNTTEEKDENDTIFWKF